MKNTLKKLLATLLIGALVLGTVGCAQTAPAETTETNAEATETATEETASESTETKVEEAPAEEVTLEVWNIWTTEADGNAVAFAKALEMYEADHPNVTINVDATENEAYKTKIKTAVAANEAPDVFFAWGAGFSQPFVESDSLLEIDKYLSEDALANLNMSTTGNFTFNDKLYGLPFISWLGVLYCNEEMFADAGVAVPNTYEELLTAVDAFKAKGIVPITVGAKDAWNAMFFQNIATVRTAGVELSTAALKKEASYDQEGFVQGAAMVEELVNVGAFDESALAFTYDEAKIAFLNAEAPMMFMGSWFAGEIQNPELSLVKDKVTAVNFPGLADGAYNNEFLGGAIDGLVVNANTEHPEVAANFVAYMTEKMSKEAFLQGSGVPVWNVDLSGEDVDPLVQEIVDLSQTSTGFIVAWDTFLAGSDVTTHLSLVQQIFAGLVSPEEFAAGMQELNE